MRDYIEKVLLKAKKPISYEKILKKIESIKTNEIGKDYILSEEEKNDIFDIIKECVGEYDIIKTPNDNYIHYLKSSFRKGRFYADRSGAGKVSVFTSYTNRDGKLVTTEEKYEIRRDKVNGAIDGDFVLIDLGNKKNSPRVEKVLDRSLDYILGEVYAVGSSYFVKPIDKKKQAITIALSDQAIEGERVAVRLLNCVNDGFYNAEVVKTFNHKDDPGEDISWEAFKYGIDNEFSDESIKQLESIPSELSDNDMIGREDLSDWMIFTIDGEDTKDMDDAISCTLNKNGNYVLGVHITDVASIIPEGSPLDIDAFRKGNSYYLGNSVFPMTPHKISNGIGSLNPYVKRKAISCIMEITKEGDIVNYRITPTVIESKLKMTYTKVNKLLKDNEYDSEYEQFADTLKMMSKLALILRKKRIKAGAIEFKGSELKAVYSDDGKITGFSLRNQDVAENLIQEFMLIANETVDKELCRSSLPCVHRVHGSPDSEKLEKFLRFLDAINVPFEKYNSYELSTSNRCYQKLVNHIASCDKLTDLLFRDAIQCMARARYSQENTGHFGLAKDHYCHFTSPVRRYADLTVHRILWDCVFNKDKSSKNRAKWIKKLPEIAERTSHMERVSDEAERDVLHMLCAKYMEDHIGEEFEAVITCVSQDCLTVQLDNNIEGTVRVRDLPGDYVYSPDSYSLVSLDGNDNYYIGDRLLLKLKSSSKETKKIDFTIINKISQTKINDSERINKKVMIKAKTDRLKRRRD